MYRGLEPHVKRGEIKRLRVVQELAKNVRIDPKLRAVSSEYEARQATYVERLERRHRWNESGEA